MSCSFDCSYFVIDCDQGWLPKFPKLQAQKGLKTPSALGLNMGINLERATVTV